MLLTVPIENKGDRAVNDIELTCTHSGNSGTVIDRNKKVLYETVPAKKRRTFKDFNMGLIHLQASRSGCDITDLKPL
jgi:hypothetical protein